MSSQGSRSRSSSRGANRSQSPKRDSKPNKLFVTNLDANGDMKKMEDQLQDLFSKHGEIASIVVKRSHNNEYCFAFVDYKDGQDATQAMKRLNGVSLGDKSMKVEFQDNSRRRKANGGQCYKCGKPGHFARQCRSERVDQRRGRSRSRSKDRKKKKSHRHRSESSQSRHGKKKDKDKDKKKHKSHKKHKKSKKKHYSSDSDSSD